MGRFGTENVTRTQVSIWIFPCFLRKSELILSVRSGREQINVIKKRAAKRIVSPSARCLTDGDKLYENEFVAVPKRRKMNRATVKIS